jgi:hypothetical protein
MFAPPAVRPPGFILPGSQVPREEDMKKFALAFAALSMLAGSAPSLAAPCKDAKGKFVKCPKAKPAKAKTCRDSKGHFAKCK